MRHRDGTDALAKYTGRLKRASTAGLTIIEMVMAIGILAIGLTGLMGSIFGAIAHQQFAQSQTVATNHARELLEVLVSTHETGEGAAFGMIEMWAAIQAAAPGVIGPQPTLPNEQFQVTFYDPFPPQPVLTQADMANRWRPIVVEVTTTWIQGQRPVQIQLNSIVNPRQG